jgi:ABC-2 type transport system ATP-binding protein
MYRVNLTSAADRPLRTYSKGMVQRVGLAQALINAPDLVFLDEPTSGLDPLGRLLVRDVIEDLRGNGTTVFLNSHLLGEVEATCDRVAFVKQGRVIHELSLKGSATALEVEIRVDCVETETLERLSAFGSVINSAWDRLRLRVESEQVLPEIARSLVASGVALYEMRCRPKTLEEWFVEVMGDDQRAG